MSETETRLSKNAVDSETRPRPSKSVIILRPISSTTTLKSAPNKVAVECDQYARCLVEG